MTEKGKFVLITGASSGIGKCISIKLSDNYNVLLIGRDYDRLNQTKLECNSSTQQIIFQIDLSQIEEIEERLGLFLAEKNIEISHFVHCAGYMKMIPLKMVANDSIYKTFNTNLFSPIFISKTLTKRSVNNGALRSIVFISSNISNRGSKAFSVYGASKSGLDGLMRNLAIELAPAVRVNSILPGAINSGMTKDIFEDEDLLNRMKLQYPLGLGDGYDIAETVSFLISEKAKWITGQQITVDGGRTINISG